MSELTPVDEFLIDKDAATQRGQKDFQLWKTWVDNGKQPEDLDPLMKQLDGLVRKATNVYAGKVNLPKAAIRAEFQIQAMKALDKYDPTRGAQLGTFLDWQLRRGRRFVTTYQNIGHIPENRIYKITDFQNAQSALRDRLGREPSNLEISDQLHWPVNQVSALSVELGRKEVPTSMLKGDMAGSGVSRETEVLSLLQYELAPEEKSVYEYVVGINGKQQLTPGQIATKLNMSPSKVSRIKLSIGQKAKKYL